MSKNPISVPLVGGICINIYEIEYGIRDMVLVGVSYEEAEWVELIYICDPIEEECAPYFIFGGVPYFLEDFALVT